MVKSNNLLQSLVKKLVYISPFFFPLYLLRFDVYGIPFTALEGFAYLLFALWLLGLITRCVGFSWDKPLRYYWLAVFVLFLGATMGVLNAPHYINLPSSEVLDAQRVALGVWKGWIVAPMLYFAVLTQTIKSNLDLKKLLRLFVYSSALVALSSYGFGLFGDGITYDFRLSGFFESANYLSLYLVPPLLISVCFMFQRIGSPRLKDYLDLSSLVIMAHALFFTKSYAAIIGVFGALILYIFYLITKSRVRKRSIVAGLIAIIITFGVVVLTQINTPKFQQFLDWENRSSTSVRLEIYEIAWGLIDENSLIGVGPGLFQANYQTKGPDILGHAPMEWNIPHPHNIFFAFWLNAGLLGLLALLMIIVFADFRFTYPLIAFWGLLIHGIFDTPFWKNDLSMIFWLVLASIVILQTYVNPPVKKRKAGIRKRLTPKLSTRPRVG
jgi:O-antigen ligase